jgi:hypothetical protein
MTSMTYALRDLSDNNLFIKDWQIVVSLEHIKIEIVERLYAYIKGNAMQAKRYKENR